MSGDYRWWTHSSISVLCPFSGFPIKMLPYPPFKLRAEAANCPRQHLLVDGKYLALKLVAQGGKPLSAHPLNPEDVQELDNYIQRCKLGSLRVKEVLKLSDVVTDPHTPAADLADAEKALSTLVASAKREFESIQRIQDCRLLQYRSRLRRHTGENASNTDDICELQAVDKIVAERTSTRKSPAQSSLASTGDSNLGTPSGSYSFSRQTSGSAPAASAIDFDLNDPTGAGAMRSGVFDSNGPFCRQQSEPANMSSFSIHHRRPPFDSPSTPISSTFGAGFSDSGFARQITSPLEYSHTSGNQFNPAMRTLTASTIYGANMAPQSDMLHLMQRLITMQRSDPQGERNGEGASDGNPSRSEDHLPPMPESQSARVSAPPDRSDEFERSLQIEAEMVHALNCPTQSTMASMGESFGSTSDTFSMPGQFSRQISSNASSVFDREFLDPVGVGGMNLEPWDSSGPFRRMVTEPAKMLVKSRNRMRFGHASATPFPSNAGVGSSDGVSTPMVYLPADYSSRSEDLPPLAESDFDFGFDSHGTFSRQQSEPASVPRLGAYSRKMPAPPTVGSSHDIFQQQGSLPTGHPQSTVDPSTSMSSRASISFSL